MRSNFRPNMRLATNILLVKANFAIALKNTYSRGISDVFSSIFFCLGGKPNSSLP